MELQSGQGLYSFHDTNIFFVNVNKATANVFLSLLQGLSKSLQ